MSEPSYEDIARRAHELSQGDDAGNDDDNWHRAERELRDGNGGGGPWAKIGSGDTSSMTTDEGEPAGGTGPD
jgi:hypothetical protein